MFINIEINSKISAKKSLTQKLFIAVRNRIN